MKILGIETSCDETAASIIEAEENDNKVKVLSNVISSSLLLHAKTGGIVPEKAAREQVRFIIPVIEKALEPVKNFKEIDSIAVTIGPGLIGSLLIGVETAKVFSFVLKKPLIPVNHLHGHLYANWVKNGNYKSINFPTIGLVVSGGHTDLVLIEKHGKINWLGGTRDDAAGEAFDKVGRLLNLPYPGGPQIEKLALGIKKDFYKFPRPMIGSKDFDFSFSGLKAAVFRETEKIGTKNLNDEIKKNLCFSVQESIFGVLISKTINAVKKYNAKSLILGGGVCANETLRKKFEKELENAKLKIDFFVPEKKFCTDNAAMIATAAYFNYKKVSWKDLSANPELYFD